MSDIFKQLRDKELAVQKAQKEAKELQEKIDAVSATAHKLVGDMLFEKAKEDPAAKALLDEFLAELGKSKDKNVKAYVGYLMAEL